LARESHIPIVPAVKTDRDWNLKEMADKFRTGFILVGPYSENRQDFIDECKKMRWQKDEATGLVKHILDEKAPHVDLPMAALYAYRYYQKVTR